MSLNFSVYINARQYSKGRETQGVTKSFPQSVNGASTNLATYKKEGRAFVAVHLRLTIPFPVFEIYFSFFFVFFCRWLVSCLVTHSTLKLRPFCLAFSFWGKKLEKYLGIGS